MKKILLVFGILFLTTNLCFADQSVQVNNSRYLMYQHPTFKSEQYILDSKTGKIWQLVQTKEGRTIWEEMFFDCFNEDKTYSGRYVNPR